MEPNEDELFDDFMRDELHKIQPEFDGEAWSAMESQLDSSNVFNSEGPSEKAWDTAIREKLNQLSPSYSESAWLAMEAKLEASAGLGSSVEDAQWDTDIREKLNQLSPRYQEDAWLAMEAKLENKNKAPFWMRNWGRIAAALLLLALLYPISLLHPSFNPDYSLAQKSSDDPRKQVPINEQEGEQNTLKENEESKNTIFPRSESEWALEKEGSSDTTQRPVLQALESSPRLSLNSTREVKPQANTRLIPPNKPPFKGLTPDEKQEKALALNTPVKDHNKLLDTQAKENIESLGFREIGLKHLEKQDLSLALLAPQAKKSSFSSLQTELYRPKWAIGGGVSTEFAYIPAYEDRDVYSGISLLAQKDVSKKFRFSIGGNYFRYTQNKKNPTVESVKVSTVESQLVSLSTISIKKNRGVRIERIEVPLQFEYIWFSKKRWSSTLGLGVISGLNIQEKKLSEFEDIVIDANSGARLANINSIEEDDPQLGANVHLQLMIGLDYYINPKMRVNLQPYFKYALKDTQTFDIQVWGLRSALVYGL